MIYEHLVFQDYLSFGLSPLLFITMSLSIWIGLDSERRKTSLFNWIVISLLLISIDIIDGFLDIYSAFFELVLNIYLENLFYYIIIFRTLSAILIYLNIRNRNMKEWLWTFFAFCFPVFAIPAYFIIRNKKQDGLPLLVDEKQNNEEDVKSIKEVLKSCPNCKSINSKKLPECEYCDTNIEIN
jgi:hypothetical protein